MDYDFLGLTTLSVFLACTVEAVEALTIVLAIGAVRQWRSALLGAITALALLSIIVAVFGVSLGHISQKWLWLIVGSLLLVFGVQWLRNAILRYSGIKSLHDETAVYQKIKTEAKQKRHLFKSIDWYGFIVVFKGVLLEGLEVVFIVLSFGLNQGNYRGGILAAGLAIVMVSIAGIIVHRPLSRIPENSLKFIVGLVLTTFGTYFCSKGLGILWPGGQFTFAYILAFYLLICCGAIVWLKWGEDQVDG